MMTGRFSARTAWDRGESELARTVREARAAGKNLVDLTVSNPTVCGFDYDVETILAALTSREAMKYEPEARGMRTAREAVARYYAEHKAKVDPDAVVLTTSTSEAYSFLFRLLCEAGDDVLVAQPGYPLLNFLAELDDVRLVHYPLFYDFGWWIDFAELERKIGPRTRAIVVVHPNNPTGHATGAAERMRLEEICTRHGVALVVDEVFLDYGLEAPVESFAAAEHPCLKFMVSGLSKIAALPQMKVGWIACLGPLELQKEALGRLEIISDTFLSMNAPMQHALPVWLEGRHGISEQIVERVKKNLAVVKASRLEVLDVYAGWTAVIRLGWRGAGDVAGLLVPEAGVIVHPGSFYGLTMKDAVVISTIGLVEDQEIGMKAIAAWLESGK